MPASSSYVRAVRLVSRSVPGAELTATHSDAWGLTTVPSSMIVIGGGATGAQVASVFNASAREYLFHSGPRILPTEDEEVSATVRAAFRESGIEVKEDSGVIESFEKTHDGLRMSFSKDGRSEPAEATLP